MDEINYRKKKQFMKKRLGVFAAAIVLIIGVSYGGHPIYKVCVEDCVSGKYFSFDRDLSPVK